MKPYQEAYLELLRSVIRNNNFVWEQMEPAAFVDVSLQANRALARAVAEGSEILRESLFPTLDAILTAPAEEIADLEEFAGELMRASQTDLGLHYRIHLALLARARYDRDRDRQIQELYLLGMALYNMETMLNPNVLHLFTTRMRLYFSEGASYFETAYDDITDPQTRGYIHRCMGNIALSYEGYDTENSRAKLAAITRSIKILSDPDVQAKTPSLPWDLYLLKSHQERTTLLSYLRSGQADADAFAKVLESAQIVQNRQLAAAREKGEPLQPRWQYAYMAARYHCGAMLLPELLDGLYGLSAAREDSDMEDQSQFSHVSVPALFLEYSQNITDSREVAELIPRVHRMTKRLFSWLVRVPSNEKREVLMFYLRQFLYTYREYPGGMPFFDVLQNIFALRYPSAYVRLWITGQICAQLMRWTIEDAPEVLIGLEDCQNTEDVRRRAGQLEDFACRAGRLYDAGMVQFFNLVSSACRGMFEEEERLISQHTICGAKLLALKPSTAVFADVALGHHCRYDEKGERPENFSPRACAVRPLIYLTAVADVLTSTAEECSSRYQPAIPFEEACEQLQAGSGSLYAPFAVSLLAGKERRMQLKEQIGAWKQEAYLDIYRRRETLLQEQDG